MADNYATLFVYKNGALYDPTSVVLDDELNVYGLRHVWSKAEIAASGTSVIQNSRGEYNYSWTNPISYTEPLEYEISWKVTDGSNVYYRNKRLPTNARSIQYVAIPDVTTYYSSQAEVYNMLGGENTEQWIDNESHGQAQYVWEEILGAVDDSMNIFLEQHYDTSTLHTSRWVRRQATILACYRLTARRGNSPLYVTLAQQVQTQLEMIRDGQLRIPGVAYADYHGPTVRNYRMEDLTLGGRRNPLRVVQSQSTGQSYTGERLAYPAYWW